MSLFYFKKQKERCEMKQSIGLSMIVKNEAHIIEQTLLNIIAHIPIEYVVICDTGSTDATITCIQQFLIKHELPGKIYKEKWVNFAYNRNQCLKYIQGKTDYVLFFDADDRFEGELNLPELVADQYFFKMVYKNDVQFQRALLVRNNGMFYWRGVLHEFITSNEHITTAFLEGDYCVRYGSFGDRSKDPLRWQNDVQALTQAYYSDEDWDLKPRYAYYIAQTYFDSLMYEDAIDWFLKRIDLGGWIEEITLSYLNVGTCYKAQGQRENALNYWLKGYNYNPLRIECLYRAVELLMEEGQLIVAYHLGMIAKTIPFPEKDVFLVERELYDFWIDYQLSISAYYVGDFTTGYQCCKKILLLQPEKAIAEQTSKNLLSYHEIFLHETKEDKLRLIAIIQHYAIKNSELQPIVNELLTMV